jgi:hypothetical protein
MSLFFGVLECGKGCCERHVYAPVRHGDASCFEDWVRPMRVVALLTPSVFMGLCERSFSYTTDLCDGRKRPPKSWSQGGRRVTAMPSLLVP